MADELNQAYQKLKTERDILDKTYYVHQQLINEVLQEKDLQSIAKSAFDATRMPVLLEDRDFKPLAFAGFNLEKAQMYSGSFISWLSGGEGNGRKNKERRSRLKELKQTEDIQISYHYRRLITPIRVRHSIVG